MIRSVLALIKNKNKNSTLLFTWCSDSDHDNGDDAEYRGGRLHSPTSHLEDPRDLSPQESAPSRSSSLYVRNEITILIINKDYKL